MNSAKLKNLSPQQRKNLTKGQEHYAKARKHFIEGKFREAIDEASNTLKYLPDSADAVTIVAGSALELKDFELALKLNIKALEMAPDNEVVLNNCGKYWETVGDWGNAVQFYLHALMRNPENHTLKNNCGMALLRCGDLERGWDMWESRHETARKLGKRLTKMEPRYFAQPLWMGEHLVGKKIFIWAEQGIGDEIMYGTMLQDLAKYGGSVTLECNKRLIPLYERCYPNFKLVPFPFKAAELGLEHFDYQSSVVSLGRVLRRKFSDFPKECNILKPDPVSVEKWSKRFAEISDRRKIGLSWRSMRTGYDRDSAYAQLEDLAPLMQIPNVDFINMQYTYTQEELDRFEELYGRKLYTWDDIDLKDDILEVVSYSAALDANITPPSTPSILTGAQSIPSFIFCNASTKNMLTLGQKGHLWCPEIRLIYRGKTEKEWTPCMTKVAEAITELFSNR